MTTISVPQGDPIWKRLSRQTVVRSIAVGMVLVSGLITMRGLERMLNLTFEKPPMPLNKPLAELSRQLGIPLAFTSDGVDHKLDDDTVEMLGTKDYLLRDYTDVNRPLGQLGSTVQLNLNYFNTGSASPHVPEICWAGNGMQEAPNSRITFNVPNVKRRNGEVITLPMRLISFVPRKHEDFGLTSGGASTTDDRYLNVAYVFEVNGNYVATPKEVMSEFWKASSPHAYHTKIEITVPGTSTQAEAQEIVSRFIRVAIPEIEACLPTPDAVTAKATSSTVNH